MSHIRNYDKYKYLIGTKVNEWTILDIICDPNKSNTYFSVKCSCGTITELTVTEVLKNLKKDCGCMRRKKSNEKIIQKYKHLIDTQINKWTVLNIIPPDTEHKKTFALCKCQCGTTKQVRMQYLLDGRSKDCGCGRKKMLRETRTKNLVGQRFGKLLVRELLEESDNFNRRKYICDCDCGNQIVTSSICLIGGHTKSCGCILSYYNMYIDQFLDSINVKHQTEFPVVINNVRFRFDFYLPDYNLFIEYDGEQHYRPVRFGNQSDEELQEQFQITQQHDKIKNQYCKNNNIDLLRIPYWEKENIKNIINNHLQRLNEKGVAA